MTGTACHVCFNSFFAPAAADYVLMIKLKCVFLAQEWIGDTAYPVLRENPPSWTAVVESIPEPFSHESDNLRFLGDSPQWVRDWSGPFEVEFEELSGAIALLPAGDDQ